MIEARPFEEYKEMIQDMRKDEMIQGLYDLSKNVIEKENEIERLHSIIKEIREYIEEWQRFPHTNGSTHKELANIIGILDKENI